MSRELQHEERTRGKGFSRMARHNRRQDGSGCLFKRGREWAIRWREMEIAPDGTRQKVQRYEALGSVTRKQASDELAQRVAAQSNPSRPIRSRVAFRTLAAEWQAHVLPMYKHSTQKNHRHVLESTCCHASGTWRSSTSRGRRFRHTWPIWLTTDTRPGQPTTFTMC